VYYILAENPYPYPPDATANLSNATPRDIIGAESSWAETNYDGYYNFAQTEDWMRNLRPDLQTIIDSGVQTIIYDGNADYIFNFQGVEAMV
ncbi:hypothetical protein WOLCODRAFT_35815, partial [Wolfiporia cocos MD-104 SS10]